MAIVYELRLRDVTTSLYFVQDAKGVKFNELN